MAIFVPVRAKNTKESESSRPGDNNTPRRAEPRAYKRFLESEKQSPRETAGIPSKPSSVENIPNGPSFDLFLHLAFLFDNSSLDFHSEGWRACTSPLSLSLSLSGSIDCLYVHTSAYTRIHAKGGKNQFCSLLSILFIGEIFVGCKRYRLVREDEEWTSLNDVVARVE